MLTLLATELELSVKLLHDIPEEKVHGAAAVFTDPGTKR
jgi:hypothetical protein